MNTIENEKAAPNKLHTGHRARIKERYLRKGFASLDDTDVLELLLTYAIPRRDVYTLARELVIAFGSVDKVLSAEPAQLRSKGKLTEHTAILLKLIDDIRSKPYKFIEYRTEKLNSVKTAVEFCHRVLGGFPEEIVVELFLDGDYSVIDLVKVSRGTDRAAVLPIENIVQNALRQNVKKILIAHNHPSGNSVPSSADILATDMLKSSLFSHGAELAEHIIVAKRECTAIMHHQTIQIEDGEEFLPWKVGEE